MENETRVSETKEPEKWFEEEKDAEKFKFGRDAMLLAGTILLASLIVAGAIVATSQRLTTKTPAKETAQNVPSAPEKEDTSATTSLDDDPVLGDKSKAKVAIVEFSDYECPFCKRFHQETFGQLVKDYVDTGKAVIAFRDFPLSFHDPNATKEAATAECVRKEKGDKVYFNFAQAVYEGTQANGKGLPAGKLDELIKKTGANPSSVNACAETDAAKQEIAKDIEDGGKVGITGTPSFVVGTLNSDGTVTGERIVGALPINNFKETIEKYLK